LNFSIAAVLGLLIFVLSLVLKGKGKEKEPAAANLRAAARGVGNVPQRRIAVRRRGRNLDDSDDQEEEQGPARAADSDEELQSKLSDPKLGAKKREKLLVKAEKRTQREAEERARNEEKLRAVQQEEERKKAEEYQAVQERLRIEEEKRLKEEQLQRELEEYNKLKELFSVEDEGCDMADADETENLLDEFIQHIQAKKVILFEELATKFSLKVPEAIDRLTQLVANGRLTGVMDDRGKFVYISETELMQFAKFIKQRGRVSIAELVENSPLSININPDMQ